MTDKKKPKFKLSEMAASPTELTLIHPVAEFNDPETGNTGATVLLAGLHSNEFKEAKEKFAESEKTAADKADLVASVFIGWNEAFDEEFSKEAVLRFVMQEGNKWAVDQIQEFVSNTTNFYKKK